MDTTVYTSSNYHYLVDVLCNKLTSDLESNGLHESTVVVPNHTLANWLSTQIAKRFGVCLNIKFVYLDSFLESYLDAGKNQTDAQITWAINLLNFIRESTDLPDEKKIQSHPIQFSWEFSTLLKKYIEYRSDWLQDWESVQAPNNWNVLFEQCWNQLQSQHHENEDPLLALISTLNHPWNVKAHSRSEALHIFGFWEISPLKWNLLHALNNTNEVITYLVLPSETYLVDLTKSNLQIPLFNEEENTLLNPRLKLLSKLIGRSRGFQAFLLDQDVLMESLSFDSNNTAKTTVLGYLQRMFIDPESNPRRKKILKKDNSIQLHSCANQKRELEVVKAVIQRAIKDQPELKLEEIHVYAPNIQDYSKWIPVVFSDLNPRSALPFSIRDSLEPDQIPVFKTLLLILEISESRWAVNAVKDLLSLTTIQQRYELTEDGVHQIKNWLQEVSIYGGLEAHDNDYSQPHHFYSWKEGLKRLILKYATGESPRFANEHNRSPDEDSPTLESFLRFFKDLEQFSKEIQNTKNDGLELISVLNQYIPIFISKGSYSFEQSVFQKTLALIQESLKKQITPNLSTSDLIFLLRKKLPKLPSPKTLARQNGIQFQSIRFEEMIPSKIKITMGMNDGSFPRNDPQRSYDLMQYSVSRFGDPSKRDCDLLWLLQSFIHAERQWCATFVGQDEYSNEEKPISHLLQTLLETVNQTLPSYCGCESEDPLIEVTQQPRFPYEEDCFKGDLLKSNFDENSFHIATQLQKQTSLKVQVDEFTPATDDDELTKDIHLVELMTFYSHPAKHYCQHVLGIKLSDPKKNVSIKNEPLLWDLNHLRNYQIDQIALSSAKEPIDKDELQKELLEASLLPLNETGYTEFQLNQTKWHRRLDEIDEQTYIRLDRQDLAPHLISTEKYNLILPRLKRPIEKIGIITPQKIKKSIELRIWIYSLGLFAADAIEALQSVTLFARDKSITFSRDDYSIEKLSKLMDLKASFTSQPMPFFPECSYIAYKKKLSPETLFEHNKWTNSQFPGEGDDAHNQLICAHMGQPFSTTFYTISDQVYTLKELSWEEQTS